MPCALCLQEKPLCKSHIIPEFAYTSLYDSNHKMWRISTDANTRTTWLSKGIYEELLCKDCENHVGAWETYARVVLDETRFPRRQTPFGWYLSGVDYKRFKLFQLSVLWRAGVTKRPEFSDAQLPRKLKGRLRQMLLNSDPGDPLDFACVMLASERKIDITGDAVFMPECRIHKGRGTCLFAMCGVFWGYAIPRANAQAEEYVISRKGEMTIGRNEDDVRKFLGQFACGAKEAGNLPQLPEV